MNKKDTIGKAGEEISCKFLVNNGYKIIERNYRQPWGEIDIVAMARDKTLVFVEVKTIFQKEGENSAISPEDNLSKNKKTKLERVCQGYALRHPELIKENRGWRIDLLALTVNNKNCLIRHYENI